MLRRPGEATELNRLIASLQATMTVTAESQARVRIQAHNAVCDKLALGLSLSLLYGSLQHVGRSLRSYIFQLLQ